MVKRAPARKRPRKAKPGTKGLGPAECRDNVGQAFVMGIGQIPLKRCGLDSFNRQDRNKNRMAAERVFV